MKTLHSTCPLTSNVLEGKKQLLVAVLHRSPVTQEILQKLMDSGITFMIRSFHCRNNAQNLSCSVPRLACG